MHLLNHFKELTILPKNAHELKGLILKLAVQGNLTDHWRSENPEIESASKLLERLKVEKDKLIKEKKIKKEKPLLNIKKEELISNLPNKWITIRLGEIGDWGAGSTPLRSNSLFYDGEINWFKSGELNNDIIDYESNEKITEFALKKASLRLNNPGDVLIAMYGATIGKTGILKIKGTTNQAVCACTPFSCITSLYLHLLLKALKDTFINQGEGGAQPNISRVKIRNQIFALPPLEEQKAIVEVVETLFKEVEQLEQLTVGRITLKEKFVTSALKQLTTLNSKKEWTFLREHFYSFFNEINNIKKLRATILQLAIQGKLTADWRVNNPNTEDASVLLKRIQKEKAQLIKDKKINKESPLPIITTEEIPYDLPQGWVWCRLGDISKQITDGEHQTPPRIPSGRKLLSAKNVRDGFIDYENCDYISEAHYQKSIKRCNPEIGDLLIVSVGGTIGRVSMVTDDTPFALVRSVAMIKNQGLEPDYLRWVMNSPMLKEIIESKKRGGAQPCLYLGEIKEFTFPIAPLEEQKAIVQKVNALMDLCDTLEQQVQQSQEQSEKLMQSVLREVFEGKKSI